MTEIDYALGPVTVLEELYPPARYAFRPVVNQAGRDVYLDDLGDVIRHYTENSLAADGFSGFEVAARQSDGLIRIRIRADDERLQAFADRHVLLFSPAAGGKAVAGMRLLKDLGVWNPMSGFPVNADKNDGDCKWNLFPPLGLNVIGQKGVLLMHYPPWQVLQQATFLEVMTMHRWNTVLTAAGVPDDERSFYRTFVDVNPIAAPGSGQSEYPCDYVPIMMASAFFDGPEERDYIRSMLELYLEPPGARGKKYTLPLLICGSPLYDPQAPGWFRTAYKEHLPTDANGTPTTNVLQAGRFRIRPDSERETPYMIANHMIAAGVTGRCTDDPSTIPDIRKYEAQDLVAASFLRQYDANPDLDPEQAARNACREYFGNDDGSGAPQPTSAEAKLAICALAQMDLYFVAEPTPHPKYDWAQAKCRCEESPHPCEPCRSPLWPENAGSG